MQLLPQFLQFASEPVPFDEVASVLADAASRVSGGPSALIGASPRHLAATLEASGFPILDSTRHQGEPAPSASTGQIPDRGCGISARQRVCFEPVFQRAILRNSSMLDAA